MRTLALVVNPPAGGAWNMAVDEALLMRADEEGIATLRFYQWSEPTLSLGYFQHFDDRDQHSASHGCAIVRRQTGGGAILHDRELTYSLTLPAEDRLARESVRLYRIAHQAMIDVLAPHLERAESSLWICENAAPPHGGREPFLCFQRRAVGDLLLVGTGDVREASQFTSSERAGNIRVPSANVKIAGSAQRRRHGALLQHGSLLLEVSPAAPELPGLRDCAGLAISASQLAAELAARIGGAIGARLAEQPLGTSVRQIVDVLEDQRYKSPGWNRRR
jgi:lipoate-protein ligase A